jgi:integrase
MLKAGEFSRENAQRLIRECFVDLSKTVEDGYRPTSVFPDLELQEQSALANEHINELKSAIASRRFPGSLLATASDLCEAHGLSFETLPTERQHDLLDGLSRAVIEQQKLFLFRLSERLIPYRVSDPLFASEINCTEPSSAADSKDTISIGPTVQDALKAYLEQGERKWTVKTHAGRKRQLRYVLEHFGSETSLTRISPHDVRAFRDGIKRLRSNHHRRFARTFTERQTDNQKHRIAGKTAALLFETVKAFFRWATEDEGYLTTNPAQNVRIESPKRPKASKSRRPFTSEELCILFSQPVFTGFRSAKRRFQAGTALVRDDYFWIPILGFYTGARLGEIVQLHLADIDLNGAIPLLKITDADGGLPGSANAKHVKSEAGIREVPLHPDVLELGFVEFVSGRAKHRKATERLFHRIPFGSDGQASTVFSKWFARFLDVAGLTDRALVFHSFRHNAEDAFRDALQPQYVIDRIIGHSDGATSALYGDGISTQTAYGAVGAMALKVRVPEILRASTVTLDVPQAVLCKAAL